MRTKQLKLLAFAAILSLAGFGCEPETSNQVLLVSPDAVQGQDVKPISKTMSRNFGSDVTMSLKGSYDYKDGLHMELLSISDTRCQKGATCSFDGDLSPTLQLSRGAIGSETKVITLSWESNKIARLNGYVFVLEGATPTSARVTVNKAPAAPGTAVATTETPKPTPTPEPSKPAAAPPTTPQNLAPNLQPTVSNPENPSDNSLKSRMRSSWLIRWLLGDPELRKKQDELKQKELAAVTPVVTTTTPNAPASPTTVSNTQQQATVTTPNVPNQPPPPPPLTAPTGNPASGTPAPTPAPINQPAPNQAPPNDENKGLVSTVVDAITTVVHTVVDAFKGDVESNNGSTLSASGEAIEIIRIAGPTANQVIDSPVIIEGEARGNWFHDGKFPVKLFDATGKLLAVAEAHSKGIWKSDDAFVKYDLQLSYDMATAPSGILILFKGTGEATKSQDPAISVPIRFGTYKTTEPAAQ